jgi:carboxymethylenebutenolidase
MGGLLSALLAAEERRLSASVVYYGAAPSAEKAAAIRCPVLGIYGGDDPRILTTVPQLAEGLRNAGQPFEQLLYPAAPHAFFNDTRSSYRPEAARDAWARTLRFLSERLTPT